MSLAWAILTITASGIAGLILGYAHGARSFTVTLDKDDDA